MFHIKVQHYLVVLSEVVSYMRHLRVLVYEECKCKCLLSVRVYQIPVAWCRFSFAIPMTLCGIINHKQLLIFIYARYTRTELGLVLYVFILVISVFRKLKNNAITRTLK